MSHADTVSVSHSLDHFRRDKGFMAYTAAAMYCGGAVVGLIDHYLPNQPDFSLAPGFAALVVAPLLVFRGPDLPRWFVSILGPIAVPLIAYAIASGPGVGDVATLYVWPVLWTTFFFGRRGAFAILAIVGVAHGLTVLSLPHANSFFGRWLDTMVALSVVAVVIRALTRRIDELISQLHGQARTDTLTGLFNRRGFEERASVELARARRDGQPITVVAFDIDHFKHINDEFGHDVGDRVLARMGSALAANTRDIDVGARFGGDEFVVLLPASESAGADAFAQRVRLALADGDGRGLVHVHVSAGIAFANAPRDIEALLRSADAALYAAKRAGRDQTSIAESAESVVASTPAV